MVATHMPSRQVLALPGGAQWAHRRVRLNEWVRERFWSIPVALVLGGVLIAVVVSRPGLLGLPADWDLGHVVSVRTANTLLQVMASSMLTFVGVVFAITLVGLPLASAQLSPRVIRTFVRSGVTKTAFGAFLAIFAFAVTAIAFDDVDNPAAASRTVGAAVAMLAIAIVMFIVYVTATMRLLEVGWVITAVANEARVAIRRTSPAASTYIGVDAPALVAEPHVIHLSATDTRGFKGVLGTVLGLDRYRLVRLGTPTTASSSCSPGSASTCRPAAPSSPSTAAPRPATARCWPASTSAVPAPSTRTRRSGSASSSRSGPRPSRPQ